MWSYGPARGAHRHCRFLPFLTGPYLTAGLDLLSRPVSLTLNLKSFRSPEPVVSEPPGPVLYERWSYPLFAEVHGQGDRSPVTAQAPELEAQTGCDLSTMAGLLQAVCTVLGLEEAPARLTLSPVILELVAALAEARS